MKKWMRALGAALVGAAVCSTPTLAQELRVGQSQNFAVGDDMTSSMSAVVGQKVGHDVAAMGGTMRRVSAGRFLFCGTYVDQTLPGEVPGFVMTHDRGANSATVAAPLTRKQQEQLGCWLGERERMNAEFKRILRASKAAKARANGPTTYTTTADVSQ